MTRHHYNKQTDQRTRPCMCCGKPFESEWIGNRLCLECREVEMETLPPLVVRVAR